MRKIVCHSCYNKRGDYASWIVFNKVMLCESCRLAAVEYLREVCELSLARPHVFLDELTQVDSKNKFRLTP